MTTVTASAGAFADHRPPPRVLLIEDDGELREAIADALAARGLKVVAVDDGQEGLRQMRQSHPDVVVLDLMMPGMDGWQFRVQQKLDPALAATPVVAMSGSQSAAAQAVDADLFLPKPCSVASIVDAIDEVLAQKRRREEPARIAQAERMASLGTLAAGVVHEINNPLTYVLLHLNHALRALPGLADGGNRRKVEQLVALLTSAHEGAERIREITRGIRSFSRVEERPRTTLDVREPLEAALLLVANDLRHRAQLVRADHGTPFVAADEGRLAQVFLNLLTNAVQALPEATAHAHEIRVTTRTDELGRAVIEIEDTGHGIPAHLLPHIFEPFFTTKPVGQGTGLGLSISHGIIRSFGGEIQVESATGRGTTFRVVLPPATAEVAVAEPGPTTDADARGGGAPAARRVLIIDADPATASRLGGSAGLEIVAAASAQQAIDLLVGGAWDAIVCDLHLPGLSGIELYQRLRSVQPRMAERVMFSTAAPLTADERVWMRTSGQRVLEKPIEPDKLIAALAAR
ncbi:MAG TPA: response regulator [Kofleriaceae bacterium]|nr:response regulator [Kofleriaceae bacterium]